MKTPYLNDKQGFAISRLTNCVLMYPFETIIHNMIFQHFITIWRITDHNFYADRGEFTDITPEITTLLKG